MSTRSFVTVLIETFASNGLRAILEANLITIDDLKSELPYGNDDLAEMFYTDVEIFKPKETSNNKEACIRVRPVDIF